jgi:hypothetical protein
MFEIMLISVRAEGCFSTIRGSSGNISFNYLHEINFRKYNIFFYENGRPMLLFSSIFFSLIGLNLDLIINQILLKYYLSNIVGASTTRDNNTRSRSLMPTLIV